jgi:hypothetical protein
VYSGSFRQFGAASIFLPLNKAFPSLWPYLIFMFYRSIYIKLVYTTNAFWWPEFEQENSKHGQLATAKPICLEGSAPNVYYGCI